MYFHVTDVMFSEEVIVFEGSNKFFTCTSTVEITVRWFVNGTLLEEPYPMGVTSQTFGVGGSLII